MKKTLLSLTLSATLLATGASALNIVLTNDDGYQTVLLNALVDKLQTKGHSVIVSAPCGHQSGAAGSIRPYLKQIPVKKLNFNATSGLLYMTDTDATYGIDDYVCVGDTDETKSFADFASGTPVHASLNGITMGDAKWGRGNYIVLSGPNEGQNLGAMVFHSGTLGATHVSLSQNIPTIALSADSSEDETYASYVAGRTIALLDALVASKKDGEPLLPNKLGLNVNFPDEGVMTATNAFKFTKVNWNNGGYTLKFGSLNEKPENMTCYGAYYGFADAKDSVRGLNYCKGATDMTGDTDSNSEGVAVKTDGYISISTIDATENAPKAKEDYTHYRLNALVK